MQLQTRAIGRRQEFKMAADVKKIRGRIKALFTLKRRTKM